ncbi:hypothetical protein TL16_g08292 [Triparma laevis f. inornata]|uniref:Uncharacterized protein n=1 Tax=Triparma laevis f. inornata TaxID=1714386 RepID=A0A9W7B0G2_9STRA|nr:hypothetical protein TL16_g08292 [Triparma laevis f. inornata]
MLYSNIDATPKSSALPGPGTTQSSSNIISSTRTGVVSSSRNENGQLVISIISPKTTLLENNVLSPGSIIIGLITRTTPSLLTLQILSLAVRSTSPPSFLPLNNLTHTAQIRIDDITSVIDSNTGITNTTDGLLDSTSPMQSYRLGDLILARIISLGDTRR